MVQRDAYLWQLARYLVLNPMQAWMVRRTQDQTWSSYRATTCEAACPKWLRSEWLLSAFGATEQVAVAHYRPFIADGIAQPGPREHPWHQWFFGSEAFIEQVRR